MRHLDLVGRDVQDTVRTARPAATTSAAPPPVDRGAERAHAVRYGPAPGRGNGTSPAPALLAAVVRAFASVGWRCGGHYRSLGPSRSVSGGSIGVEVRRVTVEFGEIPNSNAIGALAPWVGALPGAKRGRYTLPMENAPFPDRLVYRNFKMEGYA